MWQSDMARFDYALSHGCGLVYATRRPERAEYDFLYDPFNEFLPASFSILSAWFVRRTAFVYSAGVATGTGEMSVASNAPLVRFGSGIFRRSRMPSTTSTKRRAEVPSQ
jgi:hypothetical protein